LAITPLSRRIPDAIGDLVPDQGDPMLPYPPPLPPSPLIGDDLQVKLEIFSTPQRMDTPILDHLQARTPITAYKSVGSNLFSTPTQFFSPGASGSGIDNPPSVVRDSPVTPVPLTTESLKRNKNSPVSPTVTKTRRLDISVENPILTTKHYAGPLKPALDILHPSLTVLAISAGHLILARTAEIGALTAVARHRPRPDLKARSRDIAGFLQRSGIYGTEGLYLKTPRDFLRAGFQV
jgi:hypothetical protein